MTRKALVKAMEEAEEAFNNYLEENNFDPAYFELEMTGFLMTDSFDPLKSVKFLPEHKTVENGTED